MLSQSFTLQRGASRHLVARLRATRDTSDDDFSELRGRVVKRIPLFAALSWTTDRAQFYFGYPKSRAPRRARAPARCSRRSRGQWKVRLQRESPTPAGHGDETPTSDSKTGAVSTAVPAYPDLLSRSLLILRIDRWSRVSPPCPCPISISSRFSFFGSRLMFPSVPPTRAHARSPLPLALHSPDLDLMVIVPLAPGSAFGVSFRLPSENARCAAGSRSPHSSPA